MKNYNSVGSYTEEKNAHIRYSKNATVSIVEIGVMDGETSELFCQSNPSIPIVGIDPIIPDSMDARFVGNIEKIKALESKYQNYSFIHDYSYNVAKDWNQKIDYLFIDGSHIYEDVKQDFEQWLPFVVSGGIISLHDSAANRSNGQAPCWPGPSKLADELLNDKRLKYIETVFRMTIFSVV
jgi:hypothetical protein